MKLPDGDTNVFKHMNRITENDEVLLHLRLLLLVWE